MKLSQTDIGILKEIELNARAPISKIAKKLKISKQAVYRHINRYMDEGLIQHFWTLIDFSRLGYSSYLILFRLRIGSQELAEKVGTIKKMDGISWLAETSGNWDLAVNILFRDHHEFRRRFGKVCGVLKENIEKLILKYNLDNFVCSYGKIFGGQKMAVYHLIKDRSPTTITENEFRILKAISTDARISLNDICQKTGLSFPTIKKKLKKLEDERIIAGYIPAYDYNVFNASWFICIFRINSWEPIDGFVEFCKNIPEVTYMTISDSDIATVEMTVENHILLRKITDDITTRFSDLIRTFDIISVIKVHRTDYLPFEKLA